MAFLILAAEAASALGVIEFGLQGAIDAGLIRIAKPSVFAHLVLGALNEAGMFIAHSDDPKRARDDVGAAMRELLDGMRSRN